MTPVVAVRNRRHKHAALRAVTPALDRAGLGHVAPLIAVALAHDPDLGCVPVGPRRPQ